MITADARGKHSLRRGDWKYIDDTTPQAWSQGKQGTFKNATPQLYNLADDPTESRNLIDQEPDIVKRLARELNRIRNTQSTR